MGQINSRTAQPDHAAYSAGPQKTLIATRERVAPPVDEMTGPSLNLALSAMTGDTAGIVDTLDAGIVVTVDGGGEIWGTGKYEALDPGWLEAFVLWLENLSENNVPLTSILWFPRLTTR